MPPTSPPPRLAHLRMRDFLLLEHLAEVDSLSEAAGRMHVTQSAITQALHALEAAFGCALVVRGQRGQRGIRLTPDGRYLVASGERSEHVAVHAVDQQTGALSLVGRYPGGKGANWIEIVELP